MLTTEPALRRFWCPVATSAAVTDAPLAARLLTDDLVVWRAPVTGTVHAALDRCPHRWAKLSGGWLDRGCLVCPYHGWEWRGDGSLARIPQLEDGAPLPGRAHLSTVRTAERYGWVWACLDEPALDLPDIAEYGADGWRAVHEPVSQWRCPAPMIIENNLDPAHIAFVHRASFGSPKEPGVPVSDTEREPGRLITRYEVPVQSRPGDFTPTVRRTTTVVHGPFLAMIRIEYPDGLQHLMLKACTPVGDRDTVQFQTVLRNDGEQDRPGEDIVKFDAQVWDEDRSVLEPAADHGYPLDLTQQVHVRVDRPTIEYRRFLAALVSAGSSG